VSQQFNQGEMKVATLIKSSSAISDIGFPVIHSNGKTELELSELQALVGGYIETIPLHNGRTMVFNEEAKLKEHEVNEVATMMVRGLIADNDYIAGDAVLLEKGEIS
tara:strand:+ start:1186 stop:1506 length:321 start_codon:yes stop_codon:yes gene_type:complete